MGTEGEEDGKEAEPRYVCSDVVCCRQVVPLVRDLLKKEGKNRRFVKILCTERERERERETGEREWNGARARAISRHITNATPLPRSFHNSTKAAADRRNRKGTFIH